MYIVLCNLTYMPTWLICWPNILSKVFFRSNFVIQQFILSKNGLLCVILKHVRIVLLSFPPKIGWIKNSLWDYLLKIQDQAAIIFFHSAQRILSKCFQKLSSNILKIPVWKVVPFKTQQALHCCWFLHFIQTKFRH